MASGYSLFLLGRVERDFVRRPKRQNGVMSVNEFRSGKDMKQGIIAIRVTVSSSPLFLGLKDVVVCLASWLGG
jgi:hypothetical protein